MSKEKEIIKEFENILSYSQLKALSKVSLEKPLTDEEYKEIMQLGGGFLK